MKKEKIIAPKTVLNSRLPIRVQRRRTKGFKLPINTVCVTRGTKWGNPFIVGIHGTKEECLKSFKILCSGYLCMSISKPTIDTQKKYMETIKNNLQELRGKNLACFCSLKDDCHADLLLEWANGI